MPKTYNAVWVHVVFSTKERKPFLKWEIRNKICEVLKEQAKNRGIGVDTVNGMEDHLHVLIQIKPTQKVSDVVQWVKGFSSRWLNNEYNWEPKFSWQEGYGVFSVSQNDIHQIRNYIYNQEAHHRNKTYAEEIKDLTKTG
jgi:REP element-mobilizing transposase RayT